MIRVLWRKNGILCRGYATITETLAQSPERIAVLYGTHSGNCERYAQLLQSELRSRFNVHSPLSDVADIDFSGLKDLNANDTILLLMSTYGDGEPNRATLPLWNHVQKLSSEKQALDFSFSILSRGSSLYETTFARAGLKLDEKLRGLGAHQLAPAGVQDKISLYGFDEYFNWKENVLNVLKARKHFVETPFKYESAVEVKEVEPDASLTPVPIYHRLDPQAELVEVSAEILRETDRKYVAAKINLRDYECGDYAVIWPTNPQSTVDKFLSAVFGDDIRRNNFLQTPTGLTSYELLAKHLIDVNGQPDREFLLKLEDMAPSPEAAERARELLKKPAQELPSLADVLTDLSPDVPWIKSLPASAFFDLLPPLEPRKYSISSSPRTSPDWAEISCVVEHDVSTGFWGVATGELLQLTRAAPQGRLMAAVEPLPSFRIQKDPATPLLLFGVGTGVAPFCGFIRDRVAQAKHGPVGPTILFTGTRTRDDVVHLEELEAYAADERNNITFIPSYSRVENSNPNFGYIAETARSYGSLVWQHIQNGAHVYVCGDVRKVRSHVRSAVNDIMLSHEEQPNESGVKPWKRLKRAKRIHLELW